MKDNRRDFIKKSAGLAAGVSLGGINTSYAQSSYQKRSSNQVPKAYLKDAGIKFAFFNGPTSPKVPFAKQMAVNYAVSGVERISGLNAWDPEAIKATKAT